jgi:hypothetical protein
MEKWMKMRKNNRALKLISLDAGKFNFKLQNLSFDNNDVFLLIRF